MNIINNEITKIYIRFLKEEKIYTKRMEQLNKTFFIYDGFIDDLLYYYKCEINQLYTLFPSILIPNEDKRWKEYLRTIKWKDIQVNSSNNFNTKPYDIIMAFKDYCETEEKQLCDILEEIIESFENKIPEEITELFREKHLRIDMVFDFIRITRWKDKCRYGDRVFFSLKLKFWGFLGINRIKNKIY